MTRLITSEKLGCKSFMRYPNSNFIAADTKARNFPAVFYFDTQIPQKVRRL
jgi:hypothetical protein